MTEHDTIIGEYQNSFDLKYHIFPIVPPPPGTAI